MKPLVNLASEPFRNRRLFWLAILLLFAVPSYFGLAAIETMTLREREISDRQADVRQLETQFGKLEKPVKSNVTISLDQNRELVAAKDLIARRAFSWSQLLSDIERNLPISVRVLRVSVSQIQSQEKDDVIGDSDIAATLTLDVIGKTGTDVTTMINKFHESNRFKVAPISRKPVEGTDQVEFSLKVEYLPPRFGVRTSLGNQIATTKPTAPAPSQSGAKPPADAKTPEKKK